MYQVLRDGIPMRGSVGPLRKVINLIQLLEMNMDRLTHHSPFTIGKVEEESCAL